MPSMSHDTITRALRDAYTNVSLEAARDAWIASLGEAPLRYRTVLAHYAFAANFPPHAFEASLGEQSYMCRICGLSKTESVDAAEHAAWRDKGDFTLFDPVGAMLDLQLFAKDRQRPSPSTDDIATFDRMLAAVEALPPTARASAIAGAWSFVPRTNKYAREQMVATLGACGLFDTLDHPGHFTRWVGFWEYEEAPGSAGDMRPPEAWWQRDALINRDALDLLFRLRGVDRQRFAKRRWKRAIHKQPVKVGRTTLSPGDRIGVRFHDRHLVGVVLGAHDEMPVVEMYRGTWDRWPTEAQLAKAPARLVGPHYKSPLWRREPLALGAKTMTLWTWEVLATGAKPPPSPNGAKLPLPPYGFRVITPNNALFVLQTLSTERV